MKTVTTVLLTGASGRLGRWLLRALHEHGYRVIAHGRESSDLQEAETIGCSIRRLDLRKTERFDELMADVTVVIHTAALVSFRGDKPTMFTGLNVIAPLELYRAARRSGVKRFIHLSSVAALGGIRAEQSPLTPMREETPSHTGHIAVPYLQTKREADRLLRHEAAGGGPELVIVMPSILIGPQQQSTAADRSDHLLRRTLLPRLRTVVNVVDIRDVAAAIVQSITRGKPNQAYLLTAANLRIDQLAGALAQAERRSLLQLPVGLPLLRVTAALADWWGRLQNQSARLLYPALVELLGYHWAYDSSLAVAELGFAPRPLAATLSDLALAGKQEQRR